MSAVSCLLSAPLILGASMSASVTAPDPTTLLASRYQPKAAIVRHAHPGKESKAALDEATEDEYAAASLVSALDLFFWDSRSGDCAGASRNAALFIKNLGERKKPLAVGTIPRMERKCGEMVSKAIRQACGLYRTCAVVDLEEMTNPERQEKPRKPVFADGLHPTKFGALVIAEQLKASLSRLPCD